MSADTIAAVATPPGVGGVGIVRVSGPLAADIAQAIVGRVLQPRAARLCGFRDADGTLLDEGIAILFPGPRSFTGEDVLELQGHGGPILMDLLLKRCLELGARLARPGEFTERAFLNGKLDLAQAEAVADLIESSSALGVRLAGRSLQGEFSRRIDALIEALTKIRIFIEATLDFPEEEEIEPHAHEGLAEGLDAAVERTRQLLAEAHQGQVIREGLVVVIAGAPNAGKSSLLNALSRSDAAIVTPIPGTTRDILKLDIQIDGLPIRIVDTAGLRKSDDPVEMEGMRRARDQARQADLVLWIHDAVASFDQACDSGLSSECPIVHVRNKIDLLGLEPSLAVVSGRTEIAVSALTGEGLGLLREHLKECAGVSGLQEGAFIARRRHVDALARGLQHMEAAQVVLRDRLGPELVAEDLLQAQNVLGEITGRVTSDALLGRIFSSFCIGK